MLVAVPVKPMGLPVHAPCLALQAFALALQPLALTERPPIDGAVVLGLQCAGREHDRAARDERVR